MYCTDSRDLLKALPLNTPTEIELSNEDFAQVTVEPLPWRRYVSREIRLHTAYRQNLTFSTPSPTIRSSNRTSHQTTECRVRNRSKLSTWIPNAFNTAPVPTKAQPTAGLIELVKLLPDDTYFFINSWTLGSEDVLKAISNAFRSRLHLDRYKHNIYSNVTDSDLRRISTKNLAESRFHACVTQAPRQWPQRATVSSTMRQRVGAAAERLSSTSTQLR
ncbi:hypothetical protein C8F01DRAFT_1101799 [Mycena amicta]|nr:hypothetical protein C8F01DRAFT_1101799 [Mycena amicta]